MDETTTPPRQPGSGRRKRRLRDPLLSGLIDAIPWQDLLPGRFAAWRPLLAEGLGFFLENLAAHRRAEIFAAQLSLPGNASTAERLTALCAQSPALHKAAQVLARQRGLPLELRQRLQALESLPSSLQMAPLAAQLRRELGADLPVELGDAPLAEGSVAVVLPFAWTDRGKRRQGVFKLVRPGVDARLAEDRALLPDLALFLAERGRKLGLPALDYEDTFATIARLLREEVLFEREQQNLRVAREVYAGDHCLYVPRLLPWCSPRVTAMERVYGVKITDAALAESQRGRVAEALVTGLMARPFFSSADTALFHGDLHAGNLLLTQVGMRVAVLDWSLAMRLDRDQRAALVGIALGALAMDGRKIRLSLARLGDLDADDPALDGPIERALDRFVQRGGLPGLDWMLALLDDVAASGAAGYAENLIVLRKTWLSLSGVLADLAGGAVPDAGLMKMGLLHLLAELPGRSMTPLNQPGVATHASNAEILTVLARLPLATTRWWTRAARLWPHVLEAWAGEH
ncbi:MAG: phosphotransferase [Rhodocyclaceae bacterium]|nr:phosphotransferase [Rhodocyclaceae bacterium]MBX3669893.1 phosphotransferase [Rhodocyclaceae bacterium]